MVKCLNYKCNNILPDYREKRIVDMITKHRFCIPCIKYPNIGGEPLRYKCNRKYCLNLVTYQNEIYNQSRKYCSILCKHRNQFKTKSPSIGNCIVCDDMFITNLGRPQKYCGKKCRNKYNGNKRKIEKLNTKNMVIKQ